MRCAVFIRFTRSSGIVGSSPAVLMVALMLLPVMGFTSGMAYWSLRMVPMLLRVCPSLASLMMKASTSSGSYLHQLGGRLLTGRMECDLPFSCFGICSPLGFAPLPHGKLVFKNSCVRLKKPVSVGYYGKAK